MAKTQRMRRAKTYLRVDMSQLDELCDEMSSFLSPEGYDKLMRRTLNEVGKGSKKPIKEAVQSEYVAPARWIQSAVQPARIGGGVVGGLECRIPLSGSRGLGARGKRGAAFEAGGRTSKGRIKKGDRHKVWIKDVKGVKSVLPYEEEYMRGYGGQPPFINGGPFVVTRSSEKERGPLMFVSGVAMPQMPLNKSADDTREKILKVAEKRLIHNFKRMIREET